MNDLSEKKEKPKRPVTLAEASPEYLIALAERIRVNGFLAMFDLSLNDPNGYVDEHGRVENNFIPETMVMLADALVFYAEVQKKK